MDQNTKDGMIAGGIVLAAAGLIAFTAGHTVYNTVKTVKAVLAAQRAAEAAAAAQTEQGA